MAYTTRRIKIKGGTKVSLFLFCNIKIISYICLMKELIHIMTYFWDKPLEQKENTVILDGVAWLQEDASKETEVKVCLDNDLYLDLLSEFKQKDSLIHFIVKEEWKAFKTVFSNPDYAFILEDDFEVGVETENDFVVFKEFRHD